MKPFQLYISGSLFLLFGGACTRRAIRPRHRGKRNQKKKRRPRPAQDPRGGGGRSSANNRRIGSQTFRRNEAGSPATSAPRKAS